MSKTFIPKQKPKQNSHPQKQITPKETPPLKINMEQQKKKITHLQRKIIIQSSIFVGGSKCSFSHQDPPWQAFRSHNDWCRAKVSLRRTGGKWVKPKWEICTYIYRRFKANVGEHIPYMEHLGCVVFFEKGIKRNGNFLTRLWGDIYRWFLIVWGLLLMMSLYDTAKVFFSREICRHDLMWFLFDSWTA